MKSITAALLFLLTIPGLAAPKQPSFELIDIEDGDTRPRGINDNGDISGYVFTGNGTVGFVKKGNQVTLLSVPGTFATYAWGIDNEGRVSGSFFEHGGGPIVPQKGFIYQNGNYTIVSHPNANSYPGTMLFGINSGRVVGIFFDTIATSHGFVYENGQFTLIEFPGAAHTWPYGINAAGKVAGFYQPSGSDFQTQHGFTWENGRFENIDFPRPGALTSLTALNSDTLLGIVGGACNWNPFILRHGKFQDLDMPGVEAFAINESGTIVGDFGRNRGFVAKSASFLLKQKQVSP